MFRATGKVLLIIWFFSVLFGKDYVRAWNCRICDKKKVRCIIERL